MITQFLHQFGSDQTVQAICLTLFYSLAAGVIVAALGGLVITFTKRQSARLRYNLLCGLLVLFITSAFVIFFIEESSSLPTGSSTSLTTMSASVRLIVPGVGYTNSNNFLNVNNLSVFINRWSGWIVFLWLICCVAKSIKLTRQFLYIRKVRRQEVFETTNNWKDKVVSIKTMLGINRSVALFESGLVKIPVTIGHLKPVILLPVGMLLQLTTEQIESILLHEMAHISRRDYLVNILQTVVETIFFFNPAIWWLSALIREEREACCDDLVINNITRKQGYLEALMAFGSARPINNAYAMGLNHRGQLMNRLRRMVNKENQSLNAPEKLVLLSAIILLSAFTMAPKATVAVQRSISFVRNHLAKPTSIVSPGQIKSYSKVLKTNLHQLPAKQPQDGIDTAFSFKSILFNNHNNNDPANRDMSVLDSKDTRYRIVIANNKVTSLLVNDATIPDQEFANYASLIRQIDQVLASKKHDWENVQPQKFDDLKKRSFDKQVANGYDAKKVFFDKANAGLNPQKDKYLSPNDKKKWLDLKKETITKGNGNPNPQKHIPPPPDISADRQRVSEVISALVNAHVIAKPDELEWFGLSDTELIVNGKSQPMALQQQLKTKVGVKPEYGLYYGPVKMTGIGIFLDKSDVVY
jgi:bla regulator protein BlaR1